MNEDTLKGKWDQTVGRTKQDIGNVFNNPKLAEEGLAQQMKGAVEETRGHAADALKDQSEKNRHARHIEAVSEQIDEAKNSINKKIADYKESEREKDTV